MEGGKGVGVGKEGRVGRRKRGRSWNGREELEGGKEVGVGRRKRGKSWKGEKG